MAQKILFTLEARDVGVEKALIDVRDKQKAVNNEIREAKKLGNPYEPLVGETIKLRREAQSLREEQRKLNNEFKATTVPKDSLAGLRLEYSRLVDQIKNLSAAERNSNFGQNLIKNAAGVKKEIDGIEQSLGRFTGNVGNYRSAVSGLTGVFGALGVGLGVSGIIDGARSYERLFAILRQGVGSDIEAKGIFAEIKEFARETPFQLEELTGAFVKLQQRGFNPTVAQLGVLGDIATSLNKRVDQLVEAILDAQQGEFERLKEFGIKFKKDGDQLQANFKGQTTTIDNTSDAISKYILSLGKIPGVAGASLAVSKTLDGSLSNLTDNFQQLFAQIGSGGGIIKGFVDGINLVVSGINELLDTPLSEELALQKSEFNALIGVLQDTTTSEAERNRVIAEIKENYPQYIKYVGDDVKGQIDLAKTLAFGNSLFEQRILLQATEEQRTRIVRERIALENELTQALVEQERARSVGGPRGGVIRSEASELRQTENIAAGAERRVLDLRQGIVGLEQQLQDLLATSDATALRTTGKSLSELEAELGKIFGRKEDKSDGGGGGDKLKALAGSIAFLEAEVKKLEERTQNTPVNSGLLPKLIKDLDTAREKLSKAKQDFLALSFFTRTGRELTAPDAPGNEDAPVVTFEPSLLNEDNKKSAKEQAAELRRAIEDRLEAVEFPVEVKFSKEELQAIKDFEKEIEDGRKKDDERRKERDEKAEKERKDRRDAIENAAISSAQSAADAVFDIQKNNLDREQAAKFDALAAQEQQAIDAANGNAVQEAQIRKEFEKKRQELEKQGARERKKISIKEALINTALAITKALTGAPPPFNLILAATAAFAGAAQVAAINAQEFWQGGKVKRMRPGIVREKQNAPRTAHGDTVLAYLKPGEMVLNEQQQRGIAGIAGDDVFSRAGVPGASRSPLPHFATGGVVDFVPQAGFAQAQGSGVVVQATAAFTSQQITEIGRIVGEYVGNAVGSEVKRGIGEGLNDANRRLEREQVLQNQRQG